VNPGRCENVQYDLAMKFSDWIVDKKAQKLIKDFKLLGKQLFVPNAKQ
jgi:tungstate transport system substrate-binding protein